ncbi:MAG: protein-L-isoaspartate(D-aspartate) O-methyltransferase [Proteobacteria bacterium]|nr:protein-L-isoaspartate(D-aspartate) O-methyltransferase [Pseudomonadota bacterium]
MGAPESLIAAIAAQIAETAGFTGCATLSLRVRAALREVPREAFVPASERKLAYVNRALPIGHRQTISQPFVVALMTELLDVGPGDRVLEIGTGSGYQAAVLSRLVAQVYSVELIAELAARARRSLADLDYTNVEIRVGDGAEGWLEHAPYDAIIVTAAAPELPPALARQLKPGGRLVAPIGRAHDHQMLCLCTLTPRGTLATHRVLPVAFVPLRRAPPPARA